DGPRILVDRIWPRGVANEDADIAHWLKGLAPSSALRKWRGHDPDTRAELTDRDLKEPEGDDAAEELSRRRKLREEHKRVTLVFAAKDTEHNNAVALRSYIVSDQL